MSVLIKGMDIPKNCVDCEIRLKCGCKTANASGWLINKVDDNCPLKFVEVPTPHGRLADCDAVKECLEEVLSNDEYYALMLLDWAISKRTVIEAEEEE